MESPESIQDAKMQDDNLTNVHNPHLQVSQIIENHAIESHDRILPRVSKDTIIGNDSEQTNIDVHQNTPRIIDSDVKNIYANNEDTKTGVNALPKNDNLNLENISDGSSEEESSDEENSDSDELYYTYSNKHGTHSGSASSGSVVDVVRFLRQCAAMPLDVFDVLSKSRQRPIDMNSKCTTPLYATKVPIKVKASDTPEKLSDDPFAMPQAGDESFVPIDTAVEFAAHEKTNQKDCSAEKEALKNIDCMTFELQKMKDDCKGFEAVPDSAGERVELRLAEMNRKKSQKERFKDQDYTKKIRGLVFTSDGVIHRWDMNIQADTGFKPAVPPLLLKKLRIREERLKTSFKKPRSKNTN